MDKATVLRVLVEGGGLIWVLKSLVDMVGMWWDRRQVEALLRETARPDGTPTLRQARGRWLTAQFAEDGKPSSDDKKGADPSANLAAPSRQASIGLWRRFRRNGR